MPNWKKVIVSGSDATLSSVIATTGFTGSLQGTASYATQALSSSYAPSTPTFPYTGSAIITGSLEVTGSVFVQDINGKTNIDSFDRKLYGTSPPFPPSAPSVLSIDWGSRTLNDSSGISSIAWNSRQLLKSDGTTVTLDWETGAFTGSLLGTASFATQALSASYAPGGAGTPTFPYTGSAIISGSLEITGSLFVQDINGIINIDSENRNLYDTNSSSSIDWSSRYLYDIDGNRAVAWQNKVLGESNGGSSIGWDYPNLTQAVEFSSYTRNNIDLGNVGENFANFPNYAAFLPQGEILKNGVTFDGAVADFDLVYLETDNIWYPVNMTTDSSTKMLGIAFGIANFDNQVLIEGTMVVNDGTYTDTPKVDLVDHGLPIYIKTAPTIFMATTAPGIPGNYVRVLGHAYYNSTTAGEYWIMKFRPSNDWVEI
jgi:hypothetical protein